MIFIRALNLLKSQKEKLEKQVIKAIQKEEIILTMLLVSGMGILITGPDQEEVKGIHQVSVKQIAGRKEKLELLFT